MTPEALAALKAAASLPPIARRYVKLRKSGQSWLGKCCFHSDKTPSLRVHERYFKCFGCGAGGDVFSFVMRAEGVEFPEALRIVAEQCGVSVDGNRAAEATERRRRHILGPVLDERAEILAVLRHDRGRWWSEANEIERMDAEIPGDPDDPASWLLVADAADRRFVGNMVNEWMLDIEAMPDLAYVGMMDRVRMGL